MVTRPAREAVRDEPSADVLPHDETGLRAAIAARPDDLDLRAALGAVLIRRGEIEAAIAELGEALRRDHHHVPSLLEYSRAQAGWGNLAPAEQAARVAIAQRPGAETAAQLGRVLIADGRAGEAFDLIEAMLASAPDDPDLLRVRGNALKILGRMDEARRTLRRAISLAPNTAPPLISLAEIEERSHVPPLIDKLLDALTAAAEDQAADLHYALGRLLDQLGRSDEAFEHFAEGGRLMRRRVSYDEAYTRAMCERIEAVFTSESFPEKCETSNARPPRPVFIVGMARSGSTLIEQVLSCHPQIYCAGEILSFADALAEERRANPALPLYPELIPELDARSICRIASRYRDAMTTSAADAEVHVNKLLGNYLFMGAISLTLPDARFIVARRQPLDACSSIFSLNFGQHVPYSYDLGELGRYYRAYRQVMAHWSSVLPAGSIHEVEYEALVADLEGETRKLLAFLDLDWDPACLDFHRSDRPVTTASLNQVRQPLYASSVGRWRAYQRHLGPLIEALGHD